MGWVGGLLSLVFFYVVQNGASLLLASLFEDDKGRRHGTYQGAVAAYLGEQGAAWSGSEPGAAALPPIEYLAALWALHRVPPPASSCLPSR